MTRKRKAPTPEGTTLYRVFPCLASADPRSPGGALFVPQIQGQGRIDNPEHYRTFYASDVAEGAVGEAFGNFQTWSDDLFRGRPAMPGSFTALATLYLPGSSAILDLDNARELLERNLRPSAVVIRDRLKTQAWALRIYEERAWSGVRWWSYHNSEWGSHGVWDTEALELVTVAPLDRAHPAVETARQALARSWN